MSIISKRQIACHLQFLQDEPEISQYRLILSSFSSDSNNVISVGVVSVFRERSQGLIEFVNTVSSIYGCLISPLDLSPDHFFAVVKSWHLAKFPSEDLKSRVRVAAWLFDVLIPLDQSPYPSK